MKSRKWKRISLLLSVIVIFVSFAFSSEIFAKNISNYELGKRYLKLGNSHRESGNYPLSFDFLNKGLEIFARQLNFEEQYWFASANELLAYYYRDNNDFQKFNYHFNIAKSIFNKIIDFPNGSNEALNNFMFTDLLSSNCYANNETNSDILESWNSRQLKDFPGYYSGNNIDNLSLADNQIEIFPERILAFSTLKYLNISNNPIKVFPSLYKLSNLKYLDFSGTLISEVGISVGDLKNLEHLILSNNPNLERISTDIFKLTNLKTIDLRNTKVPKFFVDELRAKLFGTNILFYDIPLITPAPNLDNEEDEDIDYDIDEENYDEFDDEDFDF